MASFEIKDLTFYYPKAKKPALDNISLTIKEGNITLLCGASGSGKSTLLRNLKSCLTTNGVMKGQVLFDGRPLKDIPEKEQARRIGFVMQHPDDQIVTDKVFHELAFGLESLGASQNSMRLAVAEMAGYFGITGYFMKNVSSLSGGQKQLLNLASVAAMKPDILILDEPTSQLDPIAASDFLHTLKKLNDDLGITILLSEHRLEEALPMADDMVVMDDASIVASGKVSESISKITGNEIFKAMPAASRIFASCGVTENLPITVCEGRKMLLEKFSGKGELLHIDFNSDNADVLPEADKKDDIVLEIKDCFFRYDKNSEDILTGISIALRKGEIYTILGANGSGKSTTLSVLSGINAPYRGKIYRSGQKVKSIHPLRDKIAALPQDPRCLFTSNTVKKELDEIKAAPDEMEDIIKLLEIEDLLGAHPYDISGGEQQRVGLAKVLLMKPEIILLDEPTKGMDGGFKQKFGRYMLLLKERGITICMASHDIEFSARYSDRCGLFFGGRIVTEDEPREFFSGNYFYTTASSRMARSLFPEAILCEDVVKCIQKNEQ